MAAGGPPSRKGKTQGWESQIAAGPTAEPAIRDCEPIRIPISYGPPLEAWLDYDTHPLVGKPGKWSSLEAGTARIWFCCPGCRRQRLAKLYYFIYPASGQPSELLCRRCHDLTYLSVNCAGNAFYTCVVKPWRRLQRISELLQFARLPRARRRCLRG